MPFEVVEHLPSGHVHETDMRVERRREVGLVVFGGRDSGHWVYGRVT